MKVREGFKNITFKVQTSNLLAARRAVGCDFFFFLRIWKEYQGGRVGRSNIFWPLAYIQLDHINMAVFFWYLGKSDLSSVCYCRCVHQTSHFLQGTRTTRPCITGYPVGSGAPAPGGVEDHGLCLEGDLCRLPRPREDYRSRDTL